MANRKLNDDITVSNKEITILNKICDNYGLNFKSAVKVRSVYMVTLDNNQKVCVKRMKSGRKKILISNKVVEDLLNIGFEYTPRYLKTKKGNLYVKYKDYLFFITEWIDGTECNLNDLSEACNVVKLLAIFHNYTEKLDVHKYNLKNNVKNWCKAFINNLNDLDQYKKIIANKRLKNEFDIIYNNYIDKYYTRGLRALSILNTSQYFSISNKNSATKTICHNSFYYQNVIKKDNIYYLIDLNSLIIDLQINDLGKYISRLMYKSEYNWDFSKAKKIIESYNSIYSLSKDELEVMLALICFPHKFWKIGRKRYIKHKNWSESRYIHKLNKIIRFNELEEKFLENYIEYINNYTN